MLELVVLYGNVALLCRKLLKRGSKKRPQKTKVKKGKNVS